MNSGTFSLQITTFEKQGYSSNTNIEREKIYMLNAKGKYKLDLREHLHFIT